MKQVFSYKKISQLYRRFQFHISAFVLAAFGVWLLWEISRNPPVPDWVFYVLGVWAIALVIEMFRFIYVFRSRRKK